MTCAFCMQFHMGSLPHDLPTAMCGQARRGGKSGEPGCAPCKVFVIMGVCARCNADLHGGILYQGLKATQAYPKAFGQKLARLHQCTKARARRPFTSSVLDHDCCLGTCMCSCCSCNCCRCPSLNPILGQCSGATSSLTTGTTPAWAT